MNARNTFHHYATQIETICNEFSSAIARGASQAELVRITQPAADLLHTLAIGVRKEQDYGAAKNRPTSVGALLSGDAVQRPSVFRAGYLPPFSSIRGATQLNLREAFKKIVHADGTDASFYVDDDHYEIIICGTSQNSRPWLAVIALPILLATVKALPDRAVPDGNEA